MSCFQRCTTVIASLPSHWANANVILNPEGFSHICCRMLPFHAIPVFVDWKHNRNKKAFMPVCYYDTPSQGVHRCAVHAVQDKHANRNCHEALLRVEIWRPALWAENVCKHRFILICSSLVVICSAYCLHVLFTDAQFCFCVKMGPKQSAESSISQSTESYISNYCSKSFTGCSFESIHWENNQQIKWQHNRLSPKCQSVLLELHLHIRTAPVMIPSVSSWHIAHILYILSTHQCDLDVAWCVYMQSFWKEPCLLFWLHDFIHLFKVLCKHFSAFNSNVRTLTP